MKRHYIIPLILMFFIGCGARITTPVVSSKNPAKNSDKKVTSRGSTKAATSKNVAKAGVNPGIIAGTMNEREYRIGPGDILHISVWNNEELTMDVMVRPDGKISLPLIQDVTARGLTAEELRSVIETRLKEYLIEPVVTATVKEVNYPKFFIMGEIQKPGTYPLRETLTVLQAISLAGGFTEFASPRNIRLIRSTSSDVENIRINYYQMIKSGDQDSIHVLIPGDTIIVP